MSGTRHASQRLETPAWVAADPRLLAQHLQKRLEARLRRLPRPQVDAGLAGASGGSEAKPRNPPRAAVEERYNRFSGVTRALARFESPPILPPRKLLLEVGACLGDLAEIASDTPGDLRRSWDLLALSCSLVAGAWLRLGDREEARFFLRQAGWAVARGSRSRLTRAGILRQRARLLAAESKPHRARRLLLRLIHLHQRAGERWAYFLALSTLSRIQLRAGQPTESLVAASLATKALDPKRERAAFLRATLYLAWCCLEAGHAGLSLQGLESARALALQISQRFDELEARMAWLSARLAEREGSMAAAEASFAEAAEGYLRIEDVFSSCQVTLERVLLLLKWGRTAEIPALLSPLQTLLRQHHCPAHRIAAVVLLRKAVISGRLTEALVREALAALALPAPSRRRA